MLTTTSLPAVTCSDLRYRAGHLDHAAELLRQIAANIPGPETRAGFMGLVREHFDAMVRDRVTRLTDAENELVAAARQLQFLADEAERAMQDAAR